VSAADDVVVLEVESAASSQAIDAFLAWAQPRSHARLLYTPDVLLAIETAERRGFLLDEVYWTTIWSDRGSSSLMALLSERLSADQFRAKVDGEPNPQALIRAAIEHGAPARNTLTMRARRLINRFRSNK
jgi:hypothetical protein